MESIIQFTGLVKSLPSSFFVCGVTEKQRHSADNSYNLAFKQKAVEDAIKVVRKYKANPEDAAKDMNASLELVLEGLKQEPVTQQI